MAVQNRKSAWDEIFNTVGSGFSNLGNTISSKASEISSGINQGWNELRKPVQAPLANTGRQIQNTFQQLRQPSVTPLVQMPSFKQINTDLGRAQLKLEQEYPLYGQFFRGFGEAITPIMQNIADKPFAGGLVGKMFPQLQKPLFTSADVERIRTTSQPERPGFPSTIARLAGETLAYAPAFVLTEGMFNPITTRIATKIPQGVNLGGRLLTSMGRGAIQTAPLGLTSLLPYADTPQERLERLPGGIAGAATFGAVAGPLFTLLGIGAKSAWNKLLNQQTQGGGFFSPEQLRIVGQAKWPVKGLGQYLNDLANAAEKAGNTVIRLDITGTKPRGKLGVKLGAKPTVQEIQATFYESPAQLRSGGVTPQTRVPATIPESPQVVEPVSGFRPTELPTPVSDVPQVPIAPPFVPETPVVPPAAPIEPVQPSAQFSTPPAREIIPIDKTKYPGVDTASAVIRPDGTGSVFIQVAPEAQGKGLGTKLVQDIEKAFRDKGVSTVEINAFPEAIGFWEKMGYQQTGEIAQAGLVQMQKALEPEVSSDLSQQMREMTLKELDITVEQAQKAIGSIFSNDEIQFLTRGAKDIVTPDGDFALGKYADSIIEVIEQNGKVKERTVYHEAFHAYVHKFADEKLLRGALNQAKEVGGKGMNDSAAEEILAINFAEWVSGRQTFAGKILSFFVDLLYKIRSLMGKIDPARQIFRDIIARKRPTTPITREVGEYPSDVAPAFRKYPKGQEPVVPTGLTAEEQKVIDETVTETPPIAPTQVVAQPSAKTVAPQEVVDDLVEGIPSDPVGAKEFYDTLSQQYELPPFEELEKTASEVTVAEREIVDELKKTTLESGIARTQEVAQYKDTIRKAVKVYNLTKKSGIADIAYITDRVPQLDEALGALREKGIDINTMDELAEVAKGLPKKEVVRVSKSKAAKLKQLITSGATPEELLAELNNPLSATRREIRTRINRGVSAEKVSGTGQLRYAFDETGEPMLTEKTSMGQAKGVSPKLSDEIPAGQKILPGTGVIHPDVMARLVTTQVRRLRALRKRVGLSQEEFDVLSQNLIGKKVTSQKATYGERKKMIEKLQPENREELLGDLVAVKAVTGKKQAKVVSDTVQNIKSESPVEETLGTVKEMLNTVHEIVNLQKGSEIWKPIVPTQTGGRKGMIRIGVKNLKSLLVPFVREPLAAKLAGISEEYHAPLLAILNVSRQWGRTFADLRDKFRQNLNDEERKAVAFLTTGIKGKEFESVFGRSATTKETQHAAYLKEIFDAHYQISNMVREMAGLEPFGKIKNYIPFILDETVAEMAKIDPRLNYTKERLKTKEDFKQGLFSQDLDKILTMFGQASEAYMRMNLFGALLKKRTDELGQISNAAKVFGQLSMEKDIYGTGSLIDRAISTAKEGIDQVIGASVAPKMIKLNPAQQKVFKNTEFYATDAGFKEMVDKGEVMVPRDWAKLPDLTGAVLKTIYMTKLGFGNALFTMVNLGQPSLAVPFTSISDVAKGYAQFAQLVSFLNPSLKGQTEDVLRHSGVLDYEKYGAEYIGDKVDFLNKFLDNVAKVTNFNLTISERINRTVVLLAGVNHYTKLSEKFDLNLSKEGIWKAASELSGFINVKGGKGYAPFVVRNGPAGIFYMLQQFPLQFVDITARAIGITLNNAEKKRIVEYFFTSSNAPVEDILSIRKNYQPNDAFLKKLLYVGLALFTVPAIVYAVTESKDTAARYLPSVPTFDSPITQLFGAGMEFVRNPEQGTENFQEVLNNAFKISSIDRILQIKEEGQGAYVIRDDKGRPKYFITPDEVWKARLFGPGTLKQSEERGELYRTGLDVAKERDERTKNLMNYVLEAQKIAREQGVDASADFLFGLNLEPEDTKRVIELMEEEEKRIGATDRQLQNLSTEGRAEYIYKQLRTFRTIDEQQRYLEDAFNKGILTPDTMMELDKVFNNPPEQSILDKAFDLINRLFGVKEASAQVPEEQTRSLLGNLQQRKLEAKTKGFSPTVQDKTIRSADFDEIIKLQNQYAGTTFGDALIKRTMEAKDITEDEFQYDLKTRLPDDLQLEQIVSEIEGLKGEDLWKTLISMRYVSEGSRKPLLSDTLINKLEKLGVISESEGKVLENTAWDESSKSFKQIGGAAKPKKISLPKLKLPKPKRTKVKPIKVKRPQFKPLQIKLSTKIPKPPKTTFTGNQIQVKTKPVLIRTTMPTRLSQIGGV